MVRCLTILTLVAWATTAYAQATETIEGGAKVTKVDGKKIAIDRGTKAGIKVGTTTELFPLRARVAPSNTTVEFDVRLAVGRVTEATETSATLTVDSLAGTIEVGTYVTYPFDAPSDATASTLFRIAAQGVDLRSQETDKPFATVETLLVDRGASDKALDAMIAELKRLRSIVGDVFSDPPTTGRYRGTKATTIIDGLDRTQLTAFLGYIEAYGKSYVGQSWKLPDTFFNWVYVGAPSGETFRKKRVAQPRYLQAQEALRAGKLDDARAIYAALARELPDWDDVRDKLARIDRALGLRRAVAADADDTASALALLDELFWLGTHEAALPVVESLRKRKFDPDRLDREAALIYTALEKWVPARDLYERLAKSLPADTEIAALLVLSRARAKAAGNDPTAQLELANVLLGREEWDDAITIYRAILDGKKASAKQREAAAKGQESVSLSKQLELLIDWAKNDIAVHDVRELKLRIPAIVKLAESIGDRKRASTKLEELGYAAWSADELEVALEIMKKRIEIAPSDVSAYTALGFAYLDLDRLDDAEVTAKQALGKQGKAHLAHQILAHVARFRGDMAATKKHGTKAAEDRTYAWAPYVLARVEAASGDWEEANELARKAHELDNDARLIRSTLTATALGMQAHEALRADPKSARERLRLIRAFANLGLAKRAQEEIAKLPKDGVWRSEGYWAIASSADTQLPLNDRFAAARDAKPTTMHRKRRLAILEGRVQLRAKPGDDAARLALAKAQMLDDNYSSALAALTPLLQKDSVPAAAIALAEDARAALEQQRRYSAAWDAIGRDNQDAALAIATEMQAVFDRIGAPEGRIATREIRSEALRFLGRYAEGMKLLDEALSIAVATGEERRVAMVERRQASMIAETGTNDALAVALEKNRRTCADADDDTCLYFAHSQLADLEQGEGRLAAAIDHARLSWSLADKLGQADLGRQARVKLAIALLNANRTSDAEQVATKLLVDARAAGDPTFEQAATLLVGSVALLRGDGPAARKRFLEVYDLGTRTGQNAWRATARRFEGFAWLDADHQPKQAAIAYEAAVELYAQNTSGAASTERGTSLRRLAEARLLSGDLAGARKAADEGAALAKQFGRPLGLAAADMTFALIAIAEGKADEAVARAKTAVASTSKTDAVTMLWNAYYTLGRAYQLANNDKEALAAYETALKYLNDALLATGADSEQSGYMNTGRVREVYRNAIELLLKLGMTGRAREILELSRDAMLKQAFGRSQIATPDAATQALLDKYEAGRARLVGLQQQLDKATEKRNKARAKALGAQIASVRAELEQVARDLKVSDRQLFQALTMAPQEIAARAASLPKGTVVVEYFVASSSLEIFVHSAARKDPAVTRVKVGATELAKTVDEFRDALVAENERVKQRDKVEALGRKLENWLLQPIRTHLKDATTIVIVPFGPLYYVPFDGLVVSEAGKPLRYAIEDYRFAVQTTWTLEALMKAPRAKSTGRMLAIANPDGSLPGADREVSRIKKTALPDAQVLGRKDGTVKKVTELAGTSRYLHIATHGILDEDPRKSYLKMSDGSLTVRDIATLKGLRTNNDLVVLSACDTATELRDSAGDEVISLASSFALAGAPAVVASLWEISDDSTAELMATFYRSLERDKGDRLDALRTAKLNLMRIEKNKERPYASPWHWASFQLYGDFRAPK